MKRQKREYFNEETLDGKKLRKTADISLDAELPDSIRPREADPLDILIEQEEQEQKMHNPSTIPDDKQKMLQIVRKAKKLLSPAEFKVFVKLQEDPSYEQTQIAALLGVTKQTVHEHLNNIKRKLQGAL